MTSDTQNDVRGAVRKFIYERFPLAREMRPGDEDSLLDAGIIDSLGILDLVTFLEESLAVLAEDDDLSPENFDSIDSLVRFVETKRA